MSGGVEGGRKPPYPDSLSLVPQEGLEPPTYGLEVRGMVVSYVYCFHSPELELGQQALDVVDLIVGQYDDVDFDFGHVNLAHKGQIGIVKERWGKGRTKVVDSDRLKR
jgi:hypothetical protein